MVQRSGSGSFSWKILKQEWDRSWPFKDHPDTKPKDHEVGNYPPPNYHTHAPSPPPTSSITTETLTRAVANLATEVNRLRNLSVNVVKDVDDHKKLLDAHAELLDTVRTMKQSFVKELVIKKWDGKTVKLKNKILPKQFQRVLDLARCRRNILLVGPAGCGKTYLAKLVADSLGLDFASVSCTAGTSEAHLLGRATPNLTTGENVFHPADFLNVYENGGVGLLDELDAADPNMLLSVNSGLANWYMNVPARSKKPRAKRNDNFVCIGTANTVGRGATRLYAGRNQLDESTLDRFRIGLVECDYDPMVETAICPDIHGEEGRNWLPPVTTNGHDETIRKLVELGYNLRQTCLFIRNKIEQSGMRRIMSSRFMEDAYVMCKEADWTIAQCLEAYFSGWTSEEKAKIL